MKFIGTWKYATPLFEIITADLVIDIGIFECYVSC